jgi:hypothetical protein
VADCRQPILSSMCEETGDVPAFWTTYVQLRACVGSPDIPDQCFATLNQHIKRAVLRDDVRIWIANCSKTGCKGRTQRKDLNAG